MTAPRIVPRTEWLAARRLLLDKEKELLRRSDALAAERRALPAVKVAKDYRFVGPDGPASLRDLFGDQPQLVVYHFMFDPRWDEGCKSCSFLADTFDGAALHLAARGVSFVAVSRAPLAKLEAFRRRMGWRFRWLSSAECDFNFDFGVSFRPGDDAARAAYNFGSRPFPATLDEAPGLSVFLRDGDDVLHTYSTYARGLDGLIGTYAYLDLTPRGRDEGGLAYTMSWLRHHDRYA